MDCKQLLIEAGFSKRKAEEHASALNSAIEKHKKGCTENCKCKDTQEIKNEYDLNTEE